MEQVAGLLIAGKREARVVEVSDRFGDYGLVGAVLFDSNAEALLVESLLLSCRALGRSVEQRVAIHLGETAVQRGLRFVDIAYIETPRNLPVRQFLDNTSAEIRIDHGDHMIYRFDARRLAHIDPIAAATAAPVDKETPATSPKTAGLAQSSDPIPWLRIATEWSDMRVLAERLNEIRRQRPDLQTPFAPTQTPLEHQLAGIWGAVLGIDGIGATDGFSELGGSSLQLVQIHARIREQMGRALPLTQLFALPTVRAQAGFFAAPTTDTVPKAGALSSIQERAQRQKAAMNRHKILPYIQK
jgi:acyl carrier protein